MFIDLSSKRLAARAREAIGAMLPIESGVRNLVSRAGPIP
jgi:hypothetical protein